MIAHHVADRCRRVSIRNASLTSRMLASSAALERETPRKRSNSTLGIGRLAGIPCDSSQLSRMGKSSWAWVSTPTATVVISNACAKPIIVATSVQLLRLMAKRRVNIRSISKVSIGSSDKPPGEEKPVPMSSIATCTPAARQAPSLRRDTGRRVPEERRFGDLNVNPPPRIASQSANPSKNVARHIAVLKLRAAALSPLQRSLPRRPRSCAPNCDGAGGNHCNCGVTHPTNALS